MHLCTHTHRCFATGFVCAKIATDTWKTRCLRDLTCFLHPSDERLKFKFTSEFSEFPQKPTVQMYREAKYRLAKEVGMIQPRQDRSGAVCLCSAVDSKFLCFFQGVPLFCVVRRPDTQMETLQSQTYTLRVITLVVTSGSASEEPKISRSQILSASREDLKEMARRSTLFGSAAATWNTTIRAADTTGLIPADTKETVIPTFACELRQVYFVYTSV